MNSSKILTCPECSETFSHFTDRCPSDNAPLYTPEVMARVGKILDNYKVISILGRGGMGVVYRGEHIMLKKPVALKILHKRIANHEGASTQFLLEARAASQIRHPNIVDVTDFGKTADNIPYFVMEFLEGESLDGMLDHRTTIPLFETIDIVYQIARALASAHDLGIFHLDLKPDNIYLINREGRRSIVRKLQEGDGFVIEPEGQYNFVKVLDFGIAKFANENLEQNQTNITNKAVGTPYYMSPEQVQGLPVDARSDIYSLGILFYKMLLGVVPFDYGSLDEILNGHLMGKVPPLKETNPAVKIDNETNRTILCCLEKDPNQRFQSMDLLCEALQDCFTDRVFLRNALRLPGAIESGIVPQNRRMTGNWFDRVCKSHFSQKLMTFTSTVRRSGRSTMDTNITIPPSPQNENITTGKNLDKISFFADLLKRWWPGSR